MGNLKIGKIIQMSPPNPFEVTHCHVTFKWEDGERAELERNMFYRAVFPGQNHLQNATSFPVVFM